MTEQEAQRRDEAALFISPVSPDPNGKGVAMRAYWTLKAVAERRPTTLLVAPLGKNDPGLVSDAARALCTDVIFSAAPRLPRPGPFLFAALGVAPIPVWPSAAERVLSVFKTPAEHRTVTSGRLRRIADMLAGRRFTHIHTFRLYAAPIAFAARDALGTRPRMTLDVDDMESVTRRRFAEVHAERGDRRAAALARRAAEIYEALEDALLPQFDHLAVCSDVDAAALRRRLSTRAPAPTVGVAPNVAPSPDTVAPAPSDATLRLLFVGALHYFPNVDGLRFFLEQVAPRLDAALGPEAWTLDVIGRGGRAALPTALADHPRNRLVEEAETMPPAYARAHAVVAPIRAGGGTRIKILEAFAQGRPVVSTTLGAEGIAARDGTELLLADGAEAFAAACARLAREPDLRRSLADAGRALVAARYSPTAIAEGILGESASSTGNGEGETAAPESAAV